MLHSLPFLITLVSFHLSVSYKSSNMLLFVDYIEQTIDLLDQWRTWKNEKFCFAFICSLSNHLFYLNILFKKYIWISDPCHFPSFWKTLGISWKTILLGANSFSFFFFFCLKSSTFLHYFKNNLSRWNSHSIKLTVFQWTIQWHLASSKCATTTSD